MTTADRAAPARRAPADTISTASSFAVRTGQEVRGNQEMIGIGAADLATGLFQGFPVSNQRIPHRGGRARGLEVAASPGSPGRR